MKAVPCKCGADLAKAPPKASWIMAGTAFEVRDCPGCGTSASYTRYRQLGEGPVSLFFESTRARGISFATLGDALDATLFEEAVAPGFPADAWLIREAPAAPDVRYLARVRADGTWLLLPPEGEP